MFARGAALFAALCIAFAAASAHALMISEVQFDPNAFAPDAGDEFIELYNDSNSPVFLDDWSLGWGQDSYTEGQLDLDGLGWLAPDSFIVIGAGGVLTITPELPNGFFNAGGVALFNADSGSVNAATTPDDAVIYTIVFGFNGDLIDTDGNVGAVNANAPASGQTVARDLMGNWIIQATPDPGSGLIPEPSTGLLVGLGLAVLGVRRRATARLRR